MEIMRRGADEHFHKHGYNLYLPLPINNTVKNDERMGSNFSAPVDHVLNIESDNSIEQNIHATSIESDTSIEQRIKKGLL